MRRLVLFDIDGTLVWGGPAKDAFCQALVETYGTAGDVEGLSFAGKTDPQIARQLLSAVGFAGDAIERGFGELWDRYLGYLGDKIEHHPVDVLPGVVELLDALALLDDIGVGLLTGNIVGGAKLKLGSAGLWAHFDFGGYGSDSEERDDLPAIAVGRARDIWGETLAMHDAIVIGDTPRDVACGKAGGTRTMAVATGSYSVTDLEATEPDHLLEDLTATTDVVSLLVD